MSQEKTELKRKFSTTLKILISLWLASSMVAFFLGQEGIATGNVAVIPVYGLISVSEQQSWGASGISSDELINSLDKAEKNPAIKAILIEINSPGGSGVAADEVGQKIKSINKTTVAVIRDIGTSAAYWIASSTDHIFANRLSLTGSIGVYGSYLDFSGLMQEYNVTYRRYVSGELKDMGSPFKEPSEKEIELYQQIIDRMHEFFLEEMSENRNLSYEELQLIKDGQIFLGAEALERGLIDSLGTKDDALRYIERELGIKAEPIRYEKKKNLLDSIPSLFSFLNLKIGNFINPGVHFI